MSNPLEQLLLLTGGTTAIMAAFLLLFYGRYSRDEYTFKQVGNLIVPMLMFLGMMLVVSSVFPSFISRTAGGLERLDEEALIDALTPLSGRAELSEIAAQSVLDGGIYYTACFYEATLTYGEDKKYLEVAATQGMTIHNPTERSLDFPFRMTTRVTSLPDLPVPALSYEQLTYRLMDTNNQVVRELTWDKDRLRSDAALSIETGQTHLSKILRIGPGEHAELRLVTRSWEPTNQGMLAYSVMRKAVDMKLKVIFPNESFEKSVLFTHSRAAEPDICHVEEEPKAVKAEIRGGVLPYNGIAVTWSPRGPS